jgi:galactofuranose transport system substrate-binding protein
MKKVTRGLSILVAMLLLIGCVGCGKTTAYQKNSTKTNSSESASAGESADTSETANASANATVSTKKDTAGLKIAFSSIGAEDDAPWVGKLWNEVESVCEDNNWEFIGLSAGGVPAKQKSQIDELIDQNPDYFVLMAGDAAMADEWVKKIHYAGIPVIMIGTDSTISAYNEVSAYVGEDQEALASQLVMDMINANGASANLNVVAISGFSAQQDYILRAQGAEKTLGYFSNYNLLETQYAGCSREEAKSIMDDYLKNYDNIDVVLCYDCEFAMGALDSLKEAGKEGEIQIYTITASEETLAAMKDGYIAECAVNSAQDMADSLAETITGLENGTIPDHYKYTQREYVTVDNLSDYMDKAVY